MRSNPFDVPAVLTALRERSPVGRLRLWDGSLAWLVTGYAEARSVLTDRRFSSDPRPPGFPMVSRSFGAFRAGREPGFAQLDDPEHARLRRMVAHEFSAPRVERTCRPSARRRTAFWTV